MNVDILDDYVNELIDMDLVIQHTKTNYYIREFYYILKTNYNSRKNHFIINISNWALSEGKTTIVKSISNKYKIEFYLSLLNILKCKGLKNINIGILKVIINEYSKFLDKLPLDIIVISNDNLKILKYLNTT
jgi:hypothetical protein